MDNSISYPKEAGIYKFTCINNGKVYIGKAININRRITQHKKSKIGGYFQNAILKHGWDSFNIEVLETFKTFDKNNDGVFLLNREAYYIELYNSTDRDKGYNLCKYSNDNTGIPHSEKTKEKLRLLRLGKPGNSHSDETREKMRNAKLGKSRAPFSEETRKKMSLVRLGRKLSENHVESIKKGRLEKPMSDESRQKLRNYRLGKPLSEETKEKIRQSRLGKSHSQETKEKITQSLINKHRKNEIT